MYGKEELSNINNLCFYPTTQFKPKARRIKEIIKIGEEIIEMEEQENRENQQNQKLIL